MTLSDPARLPDRRPEPGGRPGADIVITVAGMARAAVPPETGTLSVTAGIESRDQAHALATTVELVALLRGRLDALAAARPDGSPAPVSWSSIQPIRTASWRDGAPDREVTRHSASAQVRVMFVDLAALAGFVTDVGAEPGIAINGVEWALLESTRDRLEAAVLTVAVERARSRATAIAHASGALNVRFVSIADPGLLTDGAPADRPMVALRAEAMSAGGAGAPTPEDIVIETTLHARFHAS